MRAQEFIVEYRRDKTAQAAGTKLVAALANDKGSVGDLAKMRAIATMAKQGDEITPEEIAQITDGVLAAIEDKDPTKNKQFTQWLARMYAAGGLKIEDMNRYDALATYELGKKRKMIKPEHADINRFKSYKDFEDMLSNNYDLDEIESGGEQDNKGEAETIYDDADVRVVHPEDESAACYYGRGTRWCTAATQGSNMFNHYNRQGPMYILLPKNPEYDGEKYQLHFPSEQFMDERDYGVSLVKLIKERFPGLEKFFRKKEPAFFSDVLTFADDSTLVPIIEKVKELANEAIWDTLLDWETSDDYYYQWKAEQAEERGYVDADGEIDWDRVHEDDELNDYTDYNYEAGRWLKDVQRVFDVSPEVLRDIAIELGEDDGEGTLHIENLDDVYSKLLDDEVGDEAHQIIDWVNKRLYVRKSKEGGYSVGLVEPQNVHKGLAGR